VLYEEARRFKLSAVSEQENSLIEKLRSYGVSIEELEALAGEGKTPVGPSAESVPASETRPGPEAVGAFQPLAAETTTVPVAEDASLRADAAALRQQSALFEAKPTRDRMIAEANDAAAEIRANAVRLVSMKLQAAEEEIMAMRLKATDEVAQLRRETARALTVRLQEAGSEAAALRETAREEAQAFWESASREFAEARTRVAQMRAHMAQLLASVNDAVASVEEAAGSIAALCESHLEDVPRNGQTQ